MAGIARSLERTGASKPTARTAPGRGAFVSLFAPAAGDRVQRQATSDAEQTGGAEASHSGCTCGAPGAVSDPCPGCVKVLRAASTLLGPPAASRVGLEVSRPSDPAEREADTIADHVVAGGSAIGAF